MKLDLKLRTVLVLSAAAGVMTMLVLWGPSATIPRPLASVEVTKAKVADERRDAVRRMAGRPSLNGAVRKSTASSGQAERLREQLRLGMKGFDPAVVQAEIQRVMPELIALDPQIAVILLEEFPAYRGDLLLRISQNWGRLNAPEALKWAEALTVPAEKESVRDSIAMEWATENPLEAISLVTERRENHHPEVMDVIIYRWAKQDLVSALEWIKHNPSFESGDRLAVQAVSAVMDEDPELAAISVVEEMQPGEAQNDTALMVLASWLRRDAVAARAWVAQFPDGPLREKAIAMAAGH
jgi:hypothetical protein